MTYENVLEYQERLVRNYKYRPLPTLQRDEARKLYRESLPEGFCMDGAQVPLFSREGLKIADGYHRIVIGDYGAMVEMLSEQMVHENIRTKPGQEYRENNPRYSGNVKFAWLTAKDSSDVKIYLQKKEVAYAELVPGRYYVSVFECMPPKVQERVGAEKGAVPGFTQETLEEWLKAQGVYTEKFVEYYLGLAQAYGNAIACAIAHNVPPWRVEMWLNIDDVCQGKGPLTFEQYEAVTYNVIVIGCTRDELCGKLEVLAPEARIAIEMGLEGLEFPYAIQNLPKSSIRELLRMPFEDLMCVSRFAKAAAGHKAENLAPIRDVSELIADASKRVSEATSRSKEYEREMV